MSRARAGSVPGAGAGAGLGEGGEEGCEVELWSVSCRVLVMHGLGKLTRAVAEPACNCAYCVGLTLGFIFNIFVF